LKFIEGFSEVRFISILELLFKAKNNSSAKASSLGLSPGHVIVLYRQDSSLSPCLSPITPHLLPSLSPVSKTIQSDGMW